LNFNYVQSCRVLYERKKWPAPKQVLIRQILEPTISIIIKSAR
jgi:hypothetical protein